MAGKTANSRYGAVAIILHWLIAGAIVFMMYLGKTMEPEDYQSYQLHKSLGITILALSLLRLIWRFVDPPPPLPAGISWWERIGANASHWGFYALMIGVPLGGWALASTSAFDTKVWGSFTLPKLPFIADLAGDAKDAAGERLEALHGFFGFFGFLALIALHVGAALKHHFWNRDNVLARMIPFISAPRKSS